MGYDVTVVGAGAPFERVTDIKTDFNYIKNAFNFSIFERKFLMEKSNGLSIGFIGMLSYKKIWNIVKDYDLYYFQEPNFLFSGFMKYYNKYKKNYKVILGNHGTFFEILKSKNNYFYNIIIKILAKIIFKHANKNIIIQAQNDYQFDYYTKMGFKNINIIPQNDIDFKKYHITETSDFNVVFLNKLTNNKGIKLLLDILKNNANDNIKFNIIGSGDIEKYSNDINKKNVKFFGYMNEDDKMDILSKCDIMINCSLYESLSISSIEGLASGLLLIAPEITGIIYIKNVMKDFVYTINYDYTPFIDKINELYKFKKNNYNEFINNRKLIKNNAEKIFDKDIIINSIKNMINNNDEFINNRKLIKNNAEKIFTKTR